MNRKFFICSAGKPGENWNDENFQRCIENKAHTMHQYTDPQIRGVDYEVSAQDIIFLKYNDLLVAYGEVESKGISEKIDLGDWSSCIYVKEWVFYDKNNYKKGVSNSGVSKYVIKGAGRTAVVKQITGDHAISKMKEINMDSDLYKKTQKEISMQDIRWQCLELLKQNKNLTLTGAPGTGKTYLAKIIAESICGSKTPNTQICFVQFHPSYDYSDFIEGLKPVNISGNQLNFDIKPGVFKEFCNIANQEKEKDYVFIIDEINRADLSRVFGEAFFGIEESYRGTPIKTQYSYMNGNEEFVIPKNLYIIGTMNDIDRSVESMDFALRRRFAWKEITAEDSKIIIEQAGIDDSWKEAAKNRMTSLNEKIREILGSTAYQIGGAYFKKLEKYRDEEFNTAFEKLWENHLSVILFEYVRGTTNAEESLTAMKNAYEQ